VYLAPRADVRISASFFFFCFPQTMRQEEGPRQREGAATTAGFSARISEWSVQVLAGI